MDSAYDGVDKEGVLQEGLGALTDSVINRHIQLYPGGITNGKSSMKIFCRHILNMFISAATGWVGWGGISSISLTFTFTTKLLVRGVSLVVASQEELGIGVCL